MEDEVQKQIDELFDLIREVDNQKDLFTWPIMTPKFARLALEHDRRQKEEIESLKGAIEGWREENRKLQDRITEYRRKLELQQ